MLQKMRRRLEDERGFTLIELLVVVLIIGILAAIALPTFLGQQDNAEDASAKSDARNLVSQVESCFATERTYAACDTAPEIGVTGLAYGPETDRFRLSASGPSTTTRSPPSPATRATRSRSPRPTVVRRCAPAASAARAPARAAVPGSPPSTAYSCARRVRPGPPRCV